MALITEQITEQGFEVVRDSIAAIIKTEIENQKNLPNSRITEDVGVFTGRSTPFQQSETLMINVLLDSANYSQFNEKGAHSSTNFSIDVYCTAKQNSSNTGGYLASVKRDKFVGIVRYILQDHHYKTLGLPLGFIMGTYVEGFETFEPNNSQDSAFVKMSRINFSVRINENQSLWKGLNINSIFTSVKLDLTDNGYQFLKQ